MVVCDSHKELIGTEQQICGSSQSASIPMHYLLSWLLLLFVCASSSLQECTGPGGVDNLHNQIRQAVARRYAPSLSDPNSNMTFGGKGSKTLFALTYDCTTLEGLAKASIDAAKCKVNKEFVNSANKAINFATNREKNVETAYLYAVEDWLDTAELPLSATYNPSDPSSESFANMVYYKSLKMGCYRTACTGSTTNKYAIACVYSAIPRKGQPLYIEASTKKGCAPKLCKELVSDALCQNPDEECYVPPNTCGLCQAIDGPESLEDSTSTSITSTTVSSTQAATTSTTGQASTSISSQAAASSTPSQESTAASSQTTSASTSVHVSSTKVLTTTSTLAGCMTDDIRNQVVNTFNEKRASLAKGQVQNGPTSAGKGKLSPATNMYKMGYDTELESEAQTYTNTCPPKPGKSALDTRPGHGETTIILDDKSISCADALTKAVEAWWNEITKKALNSAVKYTQVLEESVNAPTNFTQMAWAASYKVGCGVNQCDYGTIVVCRYYVRGNIYSQYIYRIGANCAACSSSCSNGLCKAPN